MSQQAVSVKETVSEQTFKSWKFADKFTYSVTEDGKIKNVVCIACSSQWQAVQKEAKRRKLRGVSFNSLKQYVDGVGYVHRSNLERHVSGNYHQLAERLQTGASPETETLDTQPSQPRIDKLLTDKSETMYTRYFHTVLWVALEELPLAKFGSALDLQRKNGLLISPGKDTRQGGDEMMKILANTVREDVKQLISECHFFSGLSDGSEARKTREEKELIYVKVLHNGVPVIVLLKCQRMIDFGGTGAVALLKSIRDAFLEYNIDIGNDGKDLGRLISMCADGASTNMGCKQGALTVLKENVPWLVIVHCSLHKLELAMKDGFKCAKDFDVIDSHMVHLFQTFKTSGKCWRVLLLLASRLGVSVRRFAKSQGTRFQAHKKNALEVFLYNFGVLLLFAENAAESQRLLTPGMKTRFQGFHKKWLKYEYPVRIRFYREILSTTAQLSLIMEKDYALLPDILDALEDCSDSLDDLQDEKWQELPEVIGSFTCTQDEPGDQINLTVRSTNIPSTLSLRDATKLSDAQKKKLEQCLAREVSSSQEFQLTHVHAGKQAMQSIQSKLIPEIKKCVDDRFSTLKSDPLIQAMRIVDQTAWDLESKDFGITNIRKVAQHFFVPLEKQAFNLDNCLQEWKQLKKITRRKYPAMKDKKMFWEKIFQNESHQLQNILLVIEICLTIAWAQGMVERGFSLTRRILADSRTSLKNTSLDDLLIIRLNVPALARVIDGYEDKLVRKSVVKYTEKRRWKLGTVVKRRSTTGTGTSAEPSSKNPRPSSSTSTAADVIQLEESSDEEMETEEGDQVEESESGSAAVLETLSDEESENTDPEMYTDSDSDTDNLADEELPS